MNGHISPQTTKNQKNTKYMILILIFLFFLSWAGDEGEREKKNGMTKRDSWQGV
jgi:hypothetical protein